jgi:hypothetical protein
MRSLLYTVNMLKIMGFYEVVNERRSIRQFEDMEIPREELERILNASLKVTLIGLLPQLAVSGPAYIFP